MNVGWRRRRFRIGLLGPGAFASWVFLTGPALASSGHEAAGWVATDTERIICFVILAGVLYFLLRKPVSAALQGRISGIREELSELEAKKNEAEAKLKAYEERFALLEQEGRKIVDDYITQGKDAQARILIQAKASAEKLEAVAKRQIEHAFDQAKDEIRTAVLEKAIEKAEAVIRAGISGEDQSRLVDEYLEKVASK